MLVYALASRSRGKECSTPVVGFYCMGAACSCVRLFVLARHWYTCRCPYDVWLPRGAVCRLNVNNKIGDGISAKNYKETTLLHYTVHCLLIHYNYKSIACLFHDWTILDCIIYKSHVQYQDSAFGTAECEHPVINFQHRQIEHRLSVPQNTITTSRPHIVSASGSK